MDKAIKKAFTELDIDPKKKALSIEELMALAKKIGFAISPSQATEAIFCAKEDVDKFHSAFTEKELQTLIQWFYDNKPILRLANRNYMKIHRQKYNNSVTVRPSINMIQTSELDDHPNPSGFQQNTIIPFSPQNTSRFGTDTPVDEVGMRLRIRVSCNVKFNKVKSHIL